MSNLSKMWIANGLMWVSLCINYFTDGVVLGQFLTGGFWVASSFWVFYAIKIAMDLIGVHKERKRLMEMIESLQNTRKNNG